MSREITINNKKINLTPLTKYETRNTNMNKKINYKKNSIFTDEQKTTSNTVFQNINIDKINKKYSNDATYSDIIKLEVDKKKYVLKLYKYKNNQNISQIKMFKKNIQSFYRDVYKNLLDTNKYLCTIYEFGDIENSKQYKFYILYDDCGENITNYFNTNINTIIDDNIDEIINGCIESVNAINKLNYIHFDTRPENFVILEENNKINVRLIDFDFSYEIMHKTGNNRRASAYFGSYFYSHPFVYLIPSLFNKKYIIRPEFDIYPIGLMYIELLVKKMKEIEFFSASTLLADYTKLELMLKSTNKDITDFYFIINTYERLKIIFNSNYYNNYFDKIFEYLDINDDNKEKNNIIKYIIYNSKLNNSFGLNKLFSNNNENISNNINNNINDFSNFILTEIDKSLIDNNIYIKSGSTINEKSTTIYKYNNQNNDANDGDADSDNNETRTSRSTSVSSTVNIRNINSKTKSIINVYYSTKKENNVHILSNEITKESKSRIDDINNKNLIIDNGTKQIIIIKDKKEIKNIIYNYFFQYYIYLKNTLKNSIDYLKNSGYKMISNKKTYILTDDDINDYYDVTGHYFENINDDLDFLLPIYEIGDIREEDNTIKYYYITDNYKTDTINGIVDKRKSKSNSREQNIIAQNIMDNVKLKLEVICNTLKKYNFNIKNKNNIIIDYDEEKKKNNTNNSKDIDNRITIKIKMLDFNVIQSDNCSQIKNNIKINKST